MNRIDGAGRLAVTLRLLGLDGPPVFEGSHEIVHDVTAVRCPECGEPLTLTLNAREGDPMRFSLSCGDGHDLKTVRDRLLALGFLKE
jgi:hypothetical protein